MKTSFCVYGIRTSLVRPGDDLAGILIEAAGKSCGLEDGDIVVIAESALATAEGRIIRLETVVPRERALLLASDYAMDPRVVEVVLSESDAIVGGIPGFLLSMKNGTLLPNAGVDASNAPPGTVIPLPVDPDGSAATIRQEIRQRCGVFVGVVVADSRTHAMRLGCSGVAIGCAGFGAVSDERGRCDLFGRELEVTRGALADNIASAAELVFGEADECVPLADVRGLGIPLSDVSGIEEIDASECLFMGVALNRDSTLLDKERES
ncbi:MAG: coenzyme F420-0:L-glutamate ligase [Methanomicrobiaceae archaeon]|nr:coenzyme F420-0:L-glutamate ligase [Methanomicrobiaceae archaeon]